VATTASEPTIQDIDAAPFTLLSGTALRRLRLRSWSWGAAAAPTVLVVHALTGDAVVAGPQGQGWWDDICGPGRTLDPRELRIVCFNNLGSCYGSSGPEDWDFDPVDGGGTLSTWDQARAILAGLDGLGIESCEMVVGGSIGGAIVLCLAALAPERFARVMPIACAPRSSAQVVAWNAIGRQAILLDPNYPEDPQGGLSLARQIAHITYRSETGLELRHGRGFVLDPPRGGGGPSGDPRFGGTFRVEEYLKSQGDRFTDRFTVQPYLALMSAMDNHDISHPPIWTDWDLSAEAVTIGGDGEFAESWGLARISGKVVAVGIDSDALFFPAHLMSMVKFLRGRGVDARYRELESLHGHDGFLIEFDQMAELIREALEA
jgi:homoserine O-acetyltransferase